MFWIRTWNITGAAQTVITTNAANLDVGGWNDHHNTANNSNALAESCHQQLGS